MKRVNVIVSGRVQGVYYRASTQEKAQSLNLSGWVRNLPDGNVEFEAEGSEEDVDALIMWAWSGPAAARVDHVDVRIIDPINDSGFEIRY